MRLLIPVICTLLLSLPVLGQPVVVKRDNGVYRAHESRITDMWEESMLLRPAGPCTVDELYIYFDGTEPARDTIWIVGDPGEGALSPTSFAWDYNTLTEPIVFDYDGVRGWDTFDLRGRGIRADGFDRIVIQHRVKEAGPWFAPDNNGVAAPLSSFLYDAVSINSLNFPGVYYAASGDFLVRLLVTYDFPRGTGSAPAPAATLVDVAKSAGLVDAQGKAILSSRVSIADWNGDGHDDIALGSRYFVNRGDGTFYLDSTGMNMPAGSTVWGDYDNDGRLDAFAANGMGGDRLYHNNGDGSFTDVTASSGIDNPMPTVTPIWLDYDRDGLLDLFISNGRTSDAQGKETYFPDQLYKNKGGGRFENVTDAAGISEGEPSPLDCWGAAACDYNQDGYVDIFVATYRLAPDLLYRNNRNGTFTEVGEATGVLGMPTVDPGAFGHGIGADWGDFNNDGWPDLVVGNLGHPDWRAQFSNPSLIFRNSPGATENSFTEMHSRMGLKFFEMNAGVVWLDLDLDGNLDLWHCQYSYEPYQPGVAGKDVRRLSRIYLNEGPGKDYHMKDVTWHTGALVHGAWTAARSDFDNDGDMDIVVASGFDGVKLFRNDVPHRGAWISVRLKGAAGGPEPMDAYGSRVRVYAGGRMFYRDLPGGGGGATASQNSNVLNFGLGEVTGIDSMVVDWSSGRHSVFAGSEITPHARYNVIYPGTVERLLSDVPDVRPVPSAWSVSNVIYRDGAVRFDLECHSNRDVEVEIVDAHGNLAAATTIDNAAPAVHSIKFDNAPSGLYLVRFTSGENRFVEKISVVR